MRGRQWLKMMITGMAWVLLCGMGGGAPEMSIPPARGVSLVDQDPDTGEIAGTINIQKAADETNLTHYVLYWGSGPTEKMGGIWSLAKTGQDLSYTLPVNTKIPQGVTHVLVYTKKDMDQSDTGISVPLTDRQSGEPAPSLVLGKLQASETFLTVNQEMTVTFSLEIQGSPAKVELWEVDQR
ncbi:MAG: hypothetical protein HQM11_21235, partial [SAR324 cluster bacterium]|nr:hypothetical protein [SAR324 cluster bacterium]